MSHQPHLGRLLGNALRRFDARVMELMSSDVGLPLKWSNYLRNGVMTAAQIHMVRHLPPEGARLTDLARGAGLSKQAMKSMMDQCEAMGLVIRGCSSANESVADRREKWIRYTAQGELWREAFLRAVMVAEQECERELGKDVLTVVRIGLEVYGSDHDRDVVAADRAQD